MHLEMLTILISLRMWHEEVKDNRFIIQCDNQACVEIITNGYTKDLKLQNLLRYITMICAAKEMELIPVYIKSSDQIYCHEFL